MKAVNRKKALKVGSKNCVMKPIPKPLVELIVNYQNHLQEKENNRKKYKPRKISFLYASLQFSKLNWSFEITKGDKK